LRSIFWLRVWLVPILEKISSIHHSNYVTFKGILFFDTKKHSLRNHFLRECSNECHREDYLFIISSGE
jgi:hypothetical protein